MKNFSLILTFFLLTLSNTVDAQYLRGEVAFTELSVDFPRELNLFEPHTPQGLTLRGGVAFGESMLQARLMGGYTHKLEAAGLVLIRHMLEADFTGLIAIPIKLDQGELPISFGGGIGAIGLGSVDNQLMQTYIPNQKVTAKYHIESGVQHKSTFVNVGVTARKFWTGSDLLDNLDVDNGNESGFQISLNCQVMLGVGIFSFGKKDKSKRKKCRQVRYP